MKRKTIMIIVTTLIILGITGYFTLKVLFSGPLYNPGDLTEKSQYSHLLKEVNRKDNPNSFTLNEGISLNYFTKGVGKPVVVIHGGPGIPHQEAWSGLDSLTAEYKFYYYDQRGCGKSTRPFDKFESNNFYKNISALNTNLGLPAQVSDIEQIRRKLGIDEITIIGHSFGGFLACLYAIEFPDRVEKLILVTPADVIKIPSETNGLYGAVEKHLPANKLEEYKSYLKEVFDFKNIFLKSEQELSDLNKKFTEYYYFATNNNTSESLTDPEIGGWVQNAVFLSMGKKHDYSEYFQRIKVPTLIIHGEEDIIPVESVQLYIDNIPNCRLETIPEAAHFSFNEQAKRFGEIVKNELKKK